MICHITTRQAWEEALKEKGGYQPPSLHLEGFIHCSFPEQAAATGKRYFAGQSGLILLWIDPARLMAEVRVEGAPPPAEQYPHVYGPLNPDAVIRVTDFDPDAP